MGNELAKARQTIESLSRQLAEAEADRDRFMHTSQLHCEGKERFCAEANRRVSEVIQERDALAVHVERIRMAMVKAKFDHLTFGIDDLEFLIGVANAESSTSLAQRDARMKAEALEACADLWDARQKGFRVHIDTDMLRLEARKYRQQAEGTA